MPLSPFFPLISELSPIKKDYSFGVGPLESDNGRK